MTVPLAASISLLLIADDEQCYAIAGIASKQGDRTLFCGNNGTTKLVLTAEMIGRAKWITEDLRSIFGPESVQFIPLTIGPIPEGANPSDYIPIGLRIAD